jgi:hypothetical protein
VATKLLSELTPKQKNRRAYYQAHKELAKQQSVAWVKANPEKVKGYQQKHRSKNREKLTAYNREYARRRRIAEPTYGYLVTPEQKARVAARVKADHAATKLEVMKAYGASCVCCGETDICFLSIDHRNGNGAEHRKTRSDGSGSMLYRSLKRQGFPQGEYQILCYNCNMAKGFYGECPHQSNARNLFLVAG